MGLLLVPWFLPRAVDAMKGSERAQAGEDALVGIAVCAVVLAFSVVAGIAVADCLHRKCCSGDAAAADENHKHRSLRYRHHDTDNDSVLAV